MQQPLAIAEQGSSRCRRDGDYRDRGVVDLTVDAAKAQRQPVLADDAFPGACLEREARLPGMRDARELVADIRPVEADFGVTDLLVVEQHEDRDDRRRAHRPAPQRQPSSLAQRGLLAAVTEPLVGWRTAAGGGQPRHLHRYGRFAKDAVTRRGPDRDRPAAGAGAADISHQPETGKPRIGIIRLRLRDLGAGKTEFHLTDQGVVDEGFQRLDPYEADGPPLDPQN